MAKPATAIHVTAGDERTLRQWVKEAAHQQLRAGRAKIVLLAAEGWSTQQIARALRERAAHVSKWRIRFATHGIGGLENAERPGKPRSYDSTTEVRILALLEQPPPAPHSFWTGPLIAQFLGNVSVDYVWRVLRARGITLRRRGGRDYETKSTVALKVISIIGIYLSSSTSAFLIGEAESTTAWPGSQLRSYVRVPNSYVARELNLHSFGASRLTVIEVLERANLFVRLGHWDGPEIRKLDDFLKDALTRSAAGEIHAFIFGSPIPSITCLHTHVVPTFREWKDQLGTWLAVFLSGAARQNAEPIRRLLAATEEFVSVHPGGKAAAFEWHNWPLSCPKGKITART